MQPDGHHPQKKKCIGGGKETSEAVPKPDRAMLAEGWAVITNDDQH
jgi:hypothetical protein